MTEPVDLWAPDRAAAKARARQAAQAARTRGTHTTKPYLPEHLTEPRRCAGCQGTLAQDEHERHPGCQEAQTA